MPYDFNIYHSLVSPSIPDYDTVSVVTTGDLTNYTTFPYVNTFGDSRYLSLLGGNLSGDLVLDNLGGIAKRLILKSANGLPVSVQAGITFVNALTSETGIIVPGLLITDGRLDITPDPILNRAEFRIKGSNSQFNIFNINTFDFYMRVNPDTSVMFGRNTVALSAGAFTTGLSSSAINTGAHAEGINTLASKVASHAEGGFSIASNEFSHAEGVNTLASGFASHAEGDQTTSSGNWSHAEGFGTTTGERVFFANYTTATRTFAFLPQLSSKFTGLTSGDILRGYEFNIDKYFTITVQNRNPINGNITATADAIGINSFSGYLVNSTGILAHAEGGNTTASGIYSHAEGVNTIASNQASHAEGEGTIASGAQSHAEGFNTTASEFAAHAEGTGTKAQGVASHAEGANTTASGFYSHAEGITTIASEYASHAEGLQTIASGSQSHAEGLNTLASESQSHAEGRDTTASGFYSHAEGVGTATGRRIPFLTYTNATKIFTFSPTVSANFNYVVPGTILKAYNPINLTFSFVTVTNRNSITGAISAAETFFTGDISNGYLIDRQGTAAHAEGENTTASGYGSHAEGVSTIASGAQSHAEGTNTIASGNQSHAEGTNTIASGSVSHAEGSGTLASGNASHAEGINTSAKTYASHAAGIFAETVHDYSWIWRGETPTGIIQPLSSTRAGQFTVHAQGGVALNNRVGIGTDSIANALTVVGEISATSTVYSSGAPVIVSSPRFETPTTNISSISNIVALSQATYNALTVKLPTTLYIIV